jgi:hypothetical protein
MPGTPEVEVVAGDPAVHGIAEAAHEVGDVAMHEGGVGGDHGIEGVGAGGGGPARLEKHERRCPGYSAERPATMW